MGLFQTSVLKKYRKLQDKEAIEKAYQKYADYFHNPERQQNIIEIKEEGFQQKFLMELFVNVFDFVINPDPNFNLTTEYKNEKGAKKADGAILKDGKALAVIELKSTKTKDLESIRQQAFDYKANQSACVYVMTSNFEKLRFYINNAVEFEEFYLFTLNIEQFALLYLCLHKDNILQNIPLKIKTDSVVAEENITKKFYFDYSQFKRELFRDLVKQNIENEVFTTELPKEDNDRVDKTIKQALFKKSQKLIDRFLFIFFAEDKGLLPPNSTLKILQDWDKLNELDTDIPLYDRFKLYFKYLDEGRKGTDKKAEIFAYNGGLFKLDPILDGLILNSQTLYKHTKTLSDYDFESQVGVNILGHIFENSLNEIESINAEIEGTDFDKQKTKRKKEGVFYTPKYITKYIVDNTIGKLCDEKKQKLEIKEEEYHKNRKGRKTGTLKKLKTKLNDYRNWLLTLSIFDPACGSGAFLNQALDFLIKEHTYIDELETSLLGGGIVFRNIENTILENNIYGVDINEESVEIAKLSLWLRTAQPRRKLNTLNNNIKCGNSLIDDQEVAGDKAFNWQKEFPLIFPKKKKKVWHITTATHNSRYSQRMYDNHVKTGDAIWLDEKDELIVTKTIAEIVKEDKLNVIAYNICGDHLHLLLVCEEEELTKRVGKIKGKTARERNRNKGINPLVRQDGEKAVSLWTQKFGKSEIKDEEYLRNAIEYIRNNRIKHELPENNEINLIISGMTCPVEQALKTEYKGGFDVVIGNPPYLRVQGLRENFEKESKYYEQIYKSATGRFDVYVLFMEKSFELIKTKGHVSFILPHKFLISDYGIGIRNFFVNNKAVESFLHFGSEMVFDDASTYTCIINLSHNNQNIKFKNIIPSNIYNNFDFQIADYKTLSGEKWNLKSKTLEKLFQKLNAQPLTVKNVFKGIFQGVVSGDNKAFYLNNCIEDDNFIIGWSDLLRENIKIEKELCKKIGNGKNINRYSFEDSMSFLIYPYKVDNAKTVLIKESELMKIAPKCYSYLNKIKERLSSRGSKNMKYPRWYSLWNYRNIDHQESVKILTPDVCFNSSMYFDEKGSLFYNDTSYALILKKNDVDIYKYYLGILNSSICWFFLKNTSSELRGGFFRFKTKYLEPFPLPQISENSNIIIDKVNYQLELNKSYQKIRNKFSKYLQAKYNIEKLSKKLQNWHELEFAEFIIELNKAIKAAKGINPLGKEKLSKSDEMEWMDLFEEKKAEAQSKKAEIEKTDKEIDKMVYELYDLAEEEIIIIENE